MFVDTVCEECRVPEGRNVCLWYRMIFDYRLLIFDLVLTTFGVKRRYPFPVKHSVPTGRVSAVYDGATNIWSLWNRMIFD